MTQPVGGTEQSYVVTVVVNGVNLGIFDSFAGGDSVAKNPKHRPGGQGDEVAYPVRPVYSDMTVSRVYQANRDVGLVTLLRPLSGMVAGSVTVQPLDADGNAYGRSNTASGMFSGVKGIKGDSASEAISTFDLDFTVTTWS